MSYLALTYKVAHLRFPLTAIRTHEGQAGSWKDPVFSAQYRDLLKIANQAAERAVYDFHLHWARSNQDIAERLGQLKGVPSKTFYTYQWRWFKAENVLVGYFAVTYLRKLKLMMTTIFRRCFSIRRPPVIPNLESQSS